MSEFADLRIASNENIKIIQKKGVKFTPDTLPGMLHLYSYRYMLLTYLITHSLQPSYRISSQNSFEYN